MPKHGGIQGRCSIKFNENCCCWFRDFRLKCCLLFIKKPPSRCFLLGSFLIFSTFLIKLSSTNGPFQTDLAINYALFFFRLLIINLSVLLLSLVFNPLADCPVGDTGCLPPADFPSPPPCG